jgi:hypothetical protein
MIPFVRRRMQFGIGAGSHNGCGALGREIAEYLNTQMTYSRYDPVLRELRHQRNGRLIYNVIHPT